ncbi:MAG TPA: tRNA preQ1(34) S-adenosylmethionine ribosyltransferase-isomerase QueA [Planctomycetes bacterium]|nr:tRNA preQ1(34) S-adenosylmethionine ribosyltransferase-isomerase QueA [Planctomycetota bacterium]
MKLSDFDFDLPPERIAQHPSERRDGARLLVHAVDRDETRHLHVRDLPELLGPDDLLVVNDTRVLNARLLGRRWSGGRVEVLLVEPLADAGGARWRAMVHPARKMHPDERIVVAEGQLCIRMVERPRRADGTPEMAWNVELQVPAGAPGTWRAAEGVAELLERHGHLPLPPYIERADDAADRERYQTVYAERPGAVAAPTAGLHFTEELLGELAERGVRRASVTLHVGPGTFRPVKAERIEDHEMHAERYELPESTVGAVAETRARGGRVVAVGTTSVRVLESCVDEHGELRAGSGWTRLFLYPGRPVHVVDSLLTNFHLPRSSLLMLVSAIAGRERVLRLYREAVEAGYRFYSYGDAMLLER